MKKKTRADKIISNSKRLVLEVISLWQLRADKIFIANEIANKFGVLMSSEQIEYIIRNKKTLTNRFAN